ncbi:PorP/SprF family type IX secretion system membrane protein [Mariniflexile ostreae]|uniref:PorP/SprF family type IX secretion system membrane protein n=1 Tax=Mariniflexile ostreae TaxID=1520892 RepID=A0ABV5F808_9FLAO
MRNYLLHIVLILCFTQLYSQEKEDGAAAFALPVRNSLKFNQYVINPTFSFVREQNKYITFSNKREWAQFDNAPQTYLFSFSGRFRENAGIGVGLFQQDYGVLTNFGAVLNYAYNAVINTDSHLTFGMNLAVYKSGLNDGKIITNFSDPSLNNIPSNTVITINPGINYGVSFFDFGLSVNNLVSYNFNTSKIIENNPQQSVQPHIMYTGYVNTSGFFDDSKFSTLIRSEFQKDNTIVSGVAMLMVPKGIWAQAGYNTLYGVSAGIGLNITSQIAIEYNFEKAMGNLSSFGNSHDITLAFKFKNRYRYNYSGDDEEVALIIPEQKPKRYLAKDNSSKTEVDREAIEEAKNKAREDAIAQAEIKSEARTVLAEEAKEKRELEARAKLELAEAEAKAQQEAASRLQAEEAAKLKLAAEAKAKADAEALAKREAAAKAQAEAAERAKLAEAETRAQQEAASRLQAEEAARLKLAAEAKAKADAEALAKREATAKAQAEAAERAKLAEAEKARLAEEAKSQIAPSDATSKSLEDLNALVQKSKVEQKDLLKALNEKLIGREKDLKDLKDENDLSEQGIYNEPKPFKSISAENAALEALKIELDNSIKSQDFKISELEKINTNRLKRVGNKKDAITAYYTNAIETLKKEQILAVRGKDFLLSRLEEIRIATEIERKRRIKRASYDNEEDRYLKDRAALKQIKSFTPKVNTPLSASDFDFGENRNKNIQIVKDVKNTEEGYYLVLAVHSDVAKRDEFLQKAVSLGQNNIDFFYDANTSKYYIYYEKFINLDTAKNAMESKGQAPYDEERSMVKIEN